MNKYGKIYQSSVIDRLNQAGAVWTDEGWIIEGDLDLSDLNLVELPLIKSVSGNFYCDNNQLISLKGAPESVGGDFYCYDNSINFIKEDVMAVCDVKGNTLTG